MTYLLAWLYLAGILPAGLVMEAAGCSKSLTWASALSWPISMPACFLIGLVHSIVTR